MGTKGICGQVSIDTLDYISNYVIDYIIDQPPSTLYLHLS